MLKRAMRMKSIMTVTGILTCTPIAWLSTPAFSDDSELNEAPSGRAWAETASPTDIIAKIRDDERWIWGVESILLRADSVWHRTPEGIESRRAELKKLNPGLDFNNPDALRQFSGLLPALHESQLLAWDKRRVVSLHEAQEVSLDHRVFDGNRTLVHEHSLETAQEHYAIFRDPEPVGATALGSFAIGRITRPSPWWCEGHKGSREDIETIPVSYRDMGMKERDGRRYRVLKQTGGPIKELWIDGETGHLTYLKTYFRPSPPQEAMEMLMELAPALLRVALSNLSKVLLELDPESFSRLSELDSALAQHPDWPDQNTIDDYMKKIRATVSQPLPDDPDQASSVQLGYTKTIILESLTIVENAGLVNVDLGAIDSAVERVVSRAPDLVTRLVEESGRELASAYPELAPLLEDQPFSEHVFKDWREMIPGKHFPFEQGYTMWITEWESAGRVNFVCPIHITELRVNEPLPDDLFVMNIEEGVKVIDRTRDPLILRYEHKDDFTDEEWDAILDEANERARRQSVRDSGYQEMIGKPAPPLETDSWLNEEPLSLDDLKGTLVVLEFFADWCGPCRTSYPQLTEYHRNNAGDDLVVIGVHAPGSAVASIKSLLKQFEIEYPIAIDSAPDERDLWGKTFAAYSIKAIPHAVLIDREGMVVVHGEVNEALREATRRMNEARH